MRQQSQQSFLQRTAPSHTAVQMTSLFDLSLRLVHCTSGSAIMEGALVIPVAISLMAGGVEFGRIYSTASTADKSMRSAARYLARLPRDAVCGWGITKA